MEDEILKHGLKAYYEMKNKNHSLWERTKEILIEILIIIFAVTVSIWLHGWDEHRQQQKEVREFLSDVKNDLQQDVQNMKTTKDSITKKNNDYYTFLNYNAADTSKQNKSSFAFSTAIITTKISSGDYEGFKSSGKIGYIEDKKLKKAILTYYQETAPSISELEKAYTTQILKIIDYVIDRLSVEQPENLFKDYKVKLMLKFYLGESEGVINQYDDAIKEANEIIKEIDKEYGN